MNAIISSSNEPYTKFMTDTLNRLEGYNVTGLAVVVLTEGDVLTGYWNMSLNDKQTAKTHIEYDCIDEFIKNNADRYGLGMEADCE